MNGSYIDQLKELGEEISKNVKHTNCKKGCTECCNTMFQISTFEFDLIQMELQKWSTQEKEKLKKEVIYAYNDILKKDKDFFKKVKHLSLTDPYTDIEIPCIFLEDGSCKIYEVRPLICRIYGSTYSQHIKGFCSKLSDLQKIKGELWHPQESFYERWVELSIVEYDEKKINIQSFPLIFLLHRELYTNNNKSFKVREYDLKFNEPKSKFQREFIRKNLSKIFKS